ncbi:lamin tail domain-containing protein [Streptomyces stramineus]|uniref:Lamin tail domain-containing protein n=1 Tax=Streptomyces stramineus TaxID=173861 RepID=A0ABN1B3V2_9ACTN
MRDRILTTVLAVSAAAAAMVTASPASAAGSVSIAEIYYNSPGSDTRSNTSLNAEWVRIKNTTSKPVSLKSWTLTDNTGYKYTFGTYTLAAGKTVKIHTGQGRDTATDRYQNRRAYVWNNDKDKATLRTSTAKVWDTCSYNNAARSSVAC